MNRRQRIFCAILGSVFFFCQQTAGQSTAPADSIFEPSRRLDPLIRYREAPIERVDVRQIPSSKGTAGLSSSFPRGSALFYMPSGRCLIGQVGLTANPAASFRIDSLHVRVEIIDETTPLAAFHSIAEGFLPQGGDLEIDFPGEQVTSLRVVYDDSMTDVEPFATVRVAAIVLASTHRLMLLGDSITDGKFAEDNLGYRKELYDLLAAKGVSVDFVGGYGDPPYEGHFQGGRKIQDFYPSSAGGTGKLDVTSDMDNYRPTVAAIHLGTNNLADGLTGPVGPYGSGMQFNSTPAGYMATLVNYLLRWHNGTRGAELQHIFVSQIVPIKYQDSLVIHFNIEIARMVRDFRSGTITGKPEPVYLADHFTRFYEDPALLSTYYRSHMYDALHPNTYGHHIMALTYLNALMPVLSAQLPWFSDVSWESNTAGSDNHFGGQGVAVADVNGDGLEDLYTTRIAINGLDRRDFYYQNDGNGIFQERATALNIHDAGDSRGALFADIDHDGDLDLFNANSPGRNRLYDDLQRTLFQEITASSGLENLNAVTTALVALDCENDGDLDLYAVNSRTSNEFYLNNGVGRFSRADRGANDVEEPDIATMSAAAADFDMDGDVDIYLLKRLAPNKLFINDGTGHFSEGAQAAGIALNHKSNGAVWADLDNDGDLDLIVSVSNITSDPSPLLHVYNNEGNGSFEDLTSGLQIPMDGYSPLVADFDNDGDADIITTGESQAGAFYRNDGNWIFSKISATGAEIFAGDVRGAAVLDVNDDGALDFYAARADVFNVLRKNNLNNPYHFLKVHAVGPEGEEGGIGTKLWLYADGQLASPAALLGYREIVSSGGHVSQSSMTQHFGLENRTLVDLLALFTDGTLLALRHINANQTLDINPAPGSSSTGPPAHLTAQSGFNQTDTVGQVLPLPLVVRVTNANGEPLAGIRVDFSVISGDAQLIPPPTGSGNIWLEAEKGRLAGGLQWAYDAGCANGGLVMSAPLRPVTGYDTLFADVSAAGTYHLWIRTLNPTIAANLAFQFDNGNRQTANLTVDNGWSWKRMSPSDGIALAAGSHRLLLETTHNNLQMDRLLLTSDAQYNPVGTGDEDGAGGYYTNREGLAQRYLQLGTTAGAVVLRAWAGESLSATFSVTARPDVAFRIEETSGNHQTGTPNVPLGQPFVVTVRDAFGNAAPGQRVVFTVRSGGGTLMPSSGQVDTDNLGQARATLTPGRASSTQEVSAESAQLSGSPINFTVSVPGIAASLVYLEGQSQVDTVLASLSKPIKFKILSLNGNPVPGFLVDVTAVEGRIATSPAIGADSVLKVASDQDGVGRIYWRLGSRAGEQTLKIESLGLAGSPIIIKANAVATRPYRLFASGGDGQEGVVATRLAGDFTARVTDRYGNAISGQTVFFRVAAGNGSFSGATQYSASTDASGDARASFTLGTLAGKNVHQVAASCSYDGKPLNGSPVSFWASARAGSPRFIFVVSGDRQNGPVRTLLPLPISVAIKDFYQNAVVSGNVIFSVTRGDGLLDGASQRTVKTDSFGIASCYFQLGTLAGLNVHEVTAIAEGLDLEQARFSASASADVAAKITYESGSGQSMVIRTTAAEPLCVRVLDQYDNPIAGHRVWFEVMSAGGTLPAGRQQQVPTGEDGRACIQFSLGGEMGDSVYVVHASALDQWQNGYLAGSPITFYLSGLHSTPVRIYPITSPYATLVGTAGSELNESVQVRVLDESGVGVPGVGVRFEVVSGGGVIQPGNTTAATVISQEDGLAPGRWQLGYLDGIQELKVSAQFEGRDLGNSPILYHAVATQLQAQQIALIQGANQSGMVGTQLGQTLKLKVMDSAGKAVKNHPVQVVIKGGGGSLGVAHDTLSVLYSDAGGMVETTWTLGLVAGEKAQRLEVSSKNAQGQHLLNSPMEVVARALPAAPSFDRSTLAANSPVQADGVAVSSIVAMLRDAYGNPVTGYAVRLQSSGLAALITPLDGITDTQGMFIAAAKSSLPGELAIRLQGYETGADLTATIKICFLAAEINRLEVASGDTQSGEVMTTLEQLCQIRAIDALGHPAAGVSIGFKFIQGSGELQRTDGTSSFPPNNLVVLTDEAGLAAVRVKLGYQSGQVILQAMATAKMEAMALFHLRALPASPAQLSIVSGDAQFGIAGHRLGQPLRVAIGDRYGNALMEEPVSFNTEFGGHFAPMEKAVSDSAGISTVMWILGIGEGEQTAHASYPGLTDVEFSAQATANQAPYLSIPDSVVIDENEKWSLILATSDAENDTICMDVDGLPAGADFDGREIRWTPGYDQAGRYPMSVTAQDHLGAATKKSLTLIVRQVNRRPDISINECLPPPQQVWPVKKPGYVDFNVVANDEDGDALSYLWLVNNTLRSAGKPSYRLQSDQVSEGETTVKVVVSDRQDTASLVWHLQVTSWVQLSAFNGNYVPGQGIVLQWRTDYESDIAGYLVTKSARRDGPFAVAGAMIKPCEGGIYQFVDAEVDAGSTWYFSLQSISSGGEIQDLGVLGLNVPVPEEFKITTPYPNPFNSCAGFTVSIPHPANVSVRIYDLTGRLLRTLFAGPCPAGFMRYQWDGRDELQREVASGIYHVRVGVDGTMRYKKVVLVR